MSFAPRSRAAVLAVAAIPVLAGCGEKEEPEFAAPTATHPAAPVDAAGPPQRDDGRPANRDGGPRGLAAARRRAANRTVRAYFKALDQRDGFLLCAVLGPGVLHEVRLPRERGSCPASLEASIGYRDPRGLPQFEGVSLAEIVSTKAGRRSARVTVTVVTTFADRDEPSIEDDIVYLERRGGFVLARADPALYRAVGAEPPLRSIVPPG